MIRIGINGFGRMGRLALRAGWGESDLAFAHVNEIAGDAATAAHLLTFDSVHGRFGHDAVGATDVLAIDDTPVVYSRIHEPGAVPWEDSEVDVVLECTGAFRRREQLDAYFERGPGLTYRCIRRHAPGSASGSPSPARDPRAARSG